MPSLSWFCAVLSPLFSIFILTIIEFLMTPLYACSYTLYNSPRLVIMIIHDYLSLSKTSD